MKAVLVVELEHYDLSTYHEGLT